MGRTVANLVYSLHNFFGALLPGDSASGFFQNSKSTEN